MTAVLYLIIMVLIYIAPLFVARVREHRNYGSIVALNLLLGWTFVGWVAALVWALTNEKPAHAS